MSLESLNNAPVTRAGLLDRARLLRQKREETTTVPQLPRIEEFDGITRTDRNPDIFDSLNELNDGIEFPSQLFEILRKGMSIERGALLLKDSETEFFTPWAQTDFDSTTLHRLRIPMNFFTGRMSDGKFSPQAEVEFSAYKNFFSMRIFDSVEKLFILPFSSGEELIGLLIILESSSTEDSILNFYNTVSDAIYDSLQNSRYLNLRRNNDTPKLSKDAIIQELDRRIEISLSKNDRLSLILLDISNILDFLKEKSPEIDLFRAGQDILSILNTMVEGIGETQSLDSTRIILLITSKTPLKNVMLLNQIKLSLMSFFQHSEEFPTLEAVLKKIPDDGMDSSIILEGLS